MAITLRSINNNLVLSDPATGRRLSILLFGLFGLILFFYGFTSEWYNNGLYVISGALIFIISLSIFPGANSRIITFDIHSKKITITSRSPFGKITEVTYSASLFRVIELGYVAGDGGGSGYTLEILQDKSDEDADSILLNENSGPMTPWFSGYDQLVKIGKEVANYLGLPFREVPFWGK